MEMYSITDFSQKAQVSRQTVYNWIRLGIIDVNRVSGRPFILSIYLDSINEIRAELSKRKGRKKSKQHSYD